MAEPKGILFEVEISKKALKKFLNHRLPALPAGITNISDLPDTSRVVDLFAHALYVCENNTKGVFLLNYKAAESLLFCAYILRNYDSEAIAPFSDLLKILSTYKDSEKVDYAIITSIVPEVEVGYMITRGDTKQVSIRESKIEIIDPLLEKFWSFLRKNDFPEPAKAFKIKDYYYKPFQNAYKKYANHQEEIARPARILQASKENPFHLFDSFYTYENKVFDISRSVVEVEKADPYSFKKLGSAFLDKNHVFSGRLANNGAPVTLQNLAHPETCWEYTTIPGIDAQTFTPIRERWDTLYWKDKNYVYVEFETTETGYTSYHKMELADVNSFEYLNFCFGKDKNHVFYKDQIIAIDPQRFDLNINGFISDNKNIYHYQNKLELDPISFKVVSVESLQNPFMGTFILEDKNGRYEYEQSKGLTPLTS